MFGAFVYDGGGTVDTGLFVIANWSCDGTTVGHVHVRGAISDTKELFDTFDVANISALHDLWVV